MNLLELWALWRKVKPWLGVIRPLLTALAALFKREPDPDAPKVHGAHDPSKPVSDDDRLKSENNPAG